MRYLANFISLLRNKENRSNEIISPKIALGKYLANANFANVTFSVCFIKICTDFSSVLLLCLVRIFMKQTLGKDPL